MCSKAFFADLDPAVGGVGHVREKRLERVPVGAVRRARELVHRTEIAGPVRAENSIRGALLMLLAHTR